MQNNSNLLDIGSIAMCSKLASKNYFVGKNRNLCQQIAQVLLKNGDKNAAQEQCNGFVYPPKRKVCM